MEDNKELFEIVNFLKAKYPKWSFLTFNYIGQTIIQCVDTKDPVVLDYLKNDKSFSKDCDELIFLNTKK